MTYTKPTDNIALRRSFRLVCNAIDLPRVEALLHEEGFRFEPEPFCTFARRLLAEPFPLGRSLAAFFGYIYIQDRSSMLPPLALQPHKDAAVLDMCASPGSKTGLLAQLVGQKGLVLGNEPTKTRLATLRNNLFTLNLLNTATCSWSGDAIPYDDITSIANEQTSGIWDYILLDPPCSGWGTTDKHPHITQLWTAEKAQSLIALQRCLLKYAYALLRPNGTLVYSTCTTHTAENEAQIRFACDQLGFICEPIKPFKGFTFSELTDNITGTLRVDENASQAQGFFIARLRKPPASIPDTPHHVTPPSYNPLNKSMLRPFGLDPEQLPPGELGLFGNNVHFLPEKALQHLPSILRWQGPIVAKNSKYGLIPSPRLRCLLNTSQKNGIPRLDMDDITPIHALLQGQSLTSQLTGKAAALFWQDLPLGRVRLKNGRVLWTEK